MTGPVPVSEDHDSPGGWLWPNVRTARGLSRAHSQGVFAAAFWIAVQAVTSVLAAVDAGGVMFAGNDHDVIAKGMIGVSLTLTACSIILYLGFLARHWAAGYLGISIVVFTVVLQIFFALLANNNVIIFLSKFYYWLAAAIVVLPLLLMFVNAARGFAAGKRSDAAIR